MPAEVHFHRRSEPAQIELTFCATREERGLGQIHLGGDFVHPRRFGRGGQQHHRRRIARERTVGKRIDLKEGKGHRHNLQLTTYNLTTHNRQLTRPAHYNGGMPRLLALLLLVAPLAVAQAPPAEQRVLFIGNSLTYNDLPALVATLARARGRVSCASIALPNYSLEDHWQRGDALREIRKGGWSLVVLQQGPSAAPESQILLREYVKRFDKEIRGAGARTSLYMVWPSRTRMQDFEGVSRSYTAAAKDVNAQVLPAGDAWRAVWARDASLSSTARMACIPHRLARTSRRL